MPKPPASGQSRANALIVLIAVVALGTSSCTSSRPTETATGTTASVAGEVPRTTVEANQTAPGQTQPTASDTTSDTAPSPTGAVVVADGLNQPTQFVIGPGRTLIIAQLNGDEDAKQGQVVLVDLGTKTSSRRRVLLDGLDKPTGVAWVNGELWVMVKRGLIRSAWDGSETDPSSPENVLAGLPFNGRSEGTLTPLPDGRLLYETSGNLIGQTIDTGRVEPGSGELHLLDAKSLRSTVVAKGTKHPYSRVLTSENQLLVTEIGDGPGSPPPDELNLIDLKQATADGAVDLGWPRCPTDREPDKPGCETIPSPLAAFPANSTPTGVATSGSFAYVALFSLGLIVRIDYTGWSRGDANRPWLVAASDLDGPYSLLADRGRVLVSEHNTGRILAFVEKSLETNKGSVS